CRLAHATGEASIMETLSTPLRAVQEAEEAVLQRVHHEARQRAVDRYQRVLRQSQLAVERQGSNVGVGRLPLAVSGLPPEDRCGQGSLGDCQLRGCLCTDR